MGWFTTAFEKFRRLPMSIQFVHITAKFVFGIGVGLLIAGYLQEYN